MLIIMEAERNNGSCPFIPRDKREMVLVGAGHEVGSVGVQNMVTHFLKQKENTV